MQNYLSTIMIIFYDWRQYKIFLFYMIYFLYQLFFFEMYLKRLYKANSAY